MEEPRICEGENSIQEKKDPKADDIVESSSSSSDNGKGSGSGGYNADCSSSDTSSLEAVKGNSLDKEMQSMSIGNRNDKNGVKKNDKASLKHAKNSKATQAMKNKNDELSSLLNNESSQSASDIQCSQGFISTSPSMPQLNGFRVQHPMDPRIDLSTVTHIQTPAMSPSLPNDVNVPHHNLPLQKPLNEKNLIEMSWSTSHAPPTVDQYLNLMNIVHPFYNAHGINQAYGITKPIDAPDKSPNGSSDSSSDQKSHNDNRKSDKTGARKDPNDSDSSSMVVLARVRKKHMKKSSEGQCHDGSNNSMNGGSNASSSSEKKVRIQNPNDQETRGDPEVDHRNGDQHEADGGQESPQADASDQQESSSSSSLENRDDPAVPQAAPRQYPAPAVVSEYSSSRTGSSGASNGNALSTSGSGSGANTGSGTGSGSNHGGSSGSGNDQGISSNGNGSSGSGNDAKGSSEYTMENSGGNNSGGNSDESNSKEKTGTNASTNTSDELLRHIAGKSEPKDVTNQLYLEGSIDSMEQNAVREKKLQDKKRKRMNMRREYEEKVQQEMESSEGSHGRDEIQIKPGRPITMDKVLSFSAIPRIVIKAFPPFLIVHTNAAYSRLSGVDSHAAVGKSISSWLSLPEQDTQAGKVANDESLRIENATVAVTSSATNPNREIQTSNHLKAEAAGRARAASAEDNITEMSFETLIATSGFGKYNPINVLSKAHNMLGRNVTVSNPPSSMEEKRHREEGGSNGSSISSSNGGSFHFFRCNMSISPVVSSQESFNVELVAEKDRDGHHHKTKRRKHHPYGDAMQACGHRKRQFITHYVIQLEKFDEKIGKYRGNTSQSSASISLEKKRLRQRSSQNNSAAESASPPVRNTGENGSGSENDQEKARMSIG